MGVETSQLSLASGIEYPSPGPLTAELYLADRGKRSGTGMPRSHVVIRVLALTEFISVATSANRSAVGLVGLVASLTVAYAAALRDHGPRGFASTAQGKPQRGIDTPRDENFSWAHRPCGFWRWLQMTEENWLNDICDSGRSAVLSCDTVLEYFVGLSFHHAGGFLTVAPVQGNLSKCRRPAGSTHLARWQALVAFVRLFCPTHASSNLRMTMANTVESGR